MGQAFEVAAINGEEPELFGGTGVQKCVENGYIVALEDVKGSEKILDEIDDSELIDNFNTYKGKTYTIPIESSFGSLVYNKDLFKQAGIVDEKGEAKPPRTWKEFREAAKKISDLGENIYGVAYPLKFASWFFYDVSFNVANEKGYIEFNHNTGEIDASGYAPWLQSVVDVINDGSAYPGSETLDNDPARARFSEGQIGMKFAFTWDYDVFTKQFPAKCDWGVTVCPVSDVNNCYYNNKSQSESFMIGRKMKEKLTDEQIVEVFDYFPNKEFQLKKYEAGTAFPWKEEVYDMADATKLTPQWKAWGEVSKSCIQRPRTPQKDMTGERTLDEIFRQDILQGKKTVEEGIKEYEEGVRRAIAKYAELHPEEADKNYIYPDLDTKMK